MPGAPFPLGETMSDEHQNCKGCADEHAPEPGPVSFVVQPQTESPADVSFCCARHLPIVVEAYSRQGWLSLVRALRSQNR
jgi:hypothetical protein